VIEVDSAGAETKRNKKLEATVAQQQQIMSNTDAQLVAAEQVLKEVRKQAADEVCEARQKAEAQQGQLQTQQGQLQSRLEQLEQVVAQKDAAMADMQSWQQELQREHDTWQRRAQQTESAVQEQIAEAWNEAGEAQELAVVVQVSCRWLRI